MLSLDALGLNEEQLKAIIHPPHIPLQVLAGPGSGKTKVLTTRIAYLVEHHGLEPSQICALTFTNKAAKEMKERLEKLIGKQKSNELVMGTFHAICVKLLHQYGMSIGLSRNFTICSAEESKRLIGGIIKDLLSDPRFCGIPIKDNEIIHQISQAKAKELHPADLPNQTTNIKQQFIASIYREYVASLKQSNSLDFDDLLLYGTRLLSKESKCLGWCKHVLVDEFQDTNFVQYKLMTQLASLNGGLTVVGDPDQSIYGWRFADVANLHRMKEDFHRTSQLFLENNYRSTAPILKFSLALISQDETRISKTLHTSYSCGTPPILHTLPSETDEAQFIAREIKRLSVHSGGLFRWNDFAILLRFNALSRNLETALQREGIPCRMLAGVKFFDRAEIKDLIAYLQLIDNPSYYPAFRRASQVPPKGIGEKSLNQLLSKATAVNQAVMEIAESIVLGKMADIKPPVEKKFSQLVGLIRKLRLLAEKGTSAANIIQELITLINYNSYLKKSKDWEHRWENVQELINFANQSDLDDGEPAAKGGTPLRRFLHNSMLSTDVGAEENGTEMVTISTCHSAKGLEWPVVFIPAAERGIFPFYRSENEKEERRLLYVACTRAQVSLYLTYSLSRLNAGERISNGISPFLSMVDKSLTSPYPSTNTRYDYEALAQLLSRPSPEKADNTSELTICEDDKLFSSAKNLLQVNESHSSLTIAHQTSELTMPIEREKAHELFWKSPSSNARRTEKGEMTTQAQVHLPQGRKRLGMGRSTQGYQPRKKAKIV